MSLDKLLEHDIYYHLMDCLETHLKQAIRENQQGMYSEEQWRRIELRHDACVMYLNQKLGG